MAEPTVAPPFDGFAPEAFAWFAGLEADNSKRWFTAHRETYERAVRGPLDAMLGELADELGGEVRLFRQHRDVRFSADKSPYKTNAACQFYHCDAGRGAGQDAEGAGAGLYFQIARGECFVAGGMWMPARASLDRIREAIAEAPDDFEGLLGAPAFRRRFRKLDREAQLKRMPRGYAETHPAAGWLRYRSFTATRMMTEREIESPRLPDILGRDFATMVPLVRWLNAAIGYRPLERRVLS